MIHSTYPFGQSVVPMRPMKAVTVKPALLSNECSRPVCRSELKQARGEAGSAGSSMNKLGTLSGHTSPSSSCDRFHCLDRISLGYALPAA